MPICAAVTHVLSLRVRLSPEGRAGVSCDRPPCVHISVPSHRELIVTSDGEALLELMYSHFPSSWAWGLSQTR
jgi:hypothetical protein